jgi:hypothetical protein
VRIIAYETLLSRRRDGKKRSERKHVGGSTHKRENLVETTTSRAAWPEPNDAMSLTELAETKFLESNRSGNDSTQTAMIMVLKARSWPDFPPQEIRPKISSQ